MSATDDAIEQRYAVPDRKEGHVNTDFTHPVQKENHAKQEQQVVISRDHVLCAQVGKCNQLHAAALLDEELVVLGDAVREDACREKGEQQKSHECQPA